MVVFVIYYFHDITKEKNSTENKTSVTCFAGYCVFIDAEHALDPSFAEALGVRTEDLLLAQPDCGEQALSLTDTFIRSGSIDVIVVDSVSSRMLESAYDLLQLVGRML